jgi:capsule biosynthesis phosphatase
MNYLITAAGIGSRFCKAGIKPPKPLIKVKGRELLLWSIGSFRLGPGDNLFIACQASHRVRQRMDEILQFLYPDTRIVWYELDEVLDGQLLTAIQAIRDLEIKGPVVIHNCDTYHDASRIDFEAILSPDVCFGLIPCFYGDGNHWSFVRTDASIQNVAIEVSEKVRISDSCSVGTYGFSSSERMIELFSQQSSGHTASGEHYIAPLYQKAIDQGELVRVCSAEKTRLFGTPEELLGTFSIDKNRLLAENAWDAHQRGTLVVDIDGTLCGGPINGDYSRVKPINNVCEALRKANEKGYYIVLFTARNMRTFRGSLGLINKYTSPVLLDWLETNNIPYDEIYFGKPWGPAVSYLDDKSLNILDFVAAHDC